MEDFQKCPAPKVLDFMAERKVVEIIIEGVILLYPSRILIGLADKAIKYGAFLCGIEYHSCHISQIPYITIYIAFIGL
jgi:hypothetical protein